MSVNIETIIDSLIGAFDEIVNVVQTNDYTNYCQLLPKLQFCMMKIFELGMRINLSKSDRHIDIVTDTSSSSVKEHHSDSADILENPEDNDEQRQVYFDQIIGCDEAKQSLYENVILPFTVSAETKAKLFTGITRGSSNIILHGPPGTGKTMLVEATACEAGAKLFVIRPSDILSKYQGESEKQLQSVFVRARQCKRAIIFFDGE